MSDKADIPEHLVKLGVIHGSCDARLEKFLNPDARNMDERTILEHLAFAKLAEIWIQTTNALLNVQFKQAQRGSKIIKPI